MKDPYEYATRAVSAEDINSLINEHLPSAPVGVTNTITKLCDVNRPGGGFYFLITTSGNLAEIIEQLLNRNPKLLDN